VHTVLYKGTLAIQLLNYVGWMPEMNVGKNMESHAGSVAKAENVALLLQRHQHLCVPRYSWTTNVQQQLPFAYEYDCLHRIASST
jgi:hypothetical protein